MGVEDSIRAARHRARLRGVTFVGVTGSCGKSTTSHLAGGILGGTLRGVVSPGSANCGDALALALLRVAPDHDFYLQELGAWGPGTLDRGLELVRPSIGVLLNIRRDHYGAFHGLANTHAEKSKLIRRLPRSGIAIVNADDELVRATGALTEAAKVWFGRSPDADLRAIEVSSAWPDRLSFSLTYGGAVYRVRTRLVGEQCLGSALAALAIAVSLGVPIGAAIRRLTEIPPLMRRMSALTVPDGITFIRDDFKAPSDSMSEVLTFMDSARATRKLAVVGRISDYPGRSRRVYTEFARAAIDVVDELSFIGERPWSLWGRGDGPWAPAHGRARVSVFSTVEAASRALREELRPGDLVLLKGSGRADHLERILHDRTVGVRCWLTDCGRDEACDDCELLTAGPARG